jgi:hypothetical protein
MSFLKTSLFIILAGVLSFNSLAQTSSYFDSPLKLRMTTLKDGVPKDNEYGFVLSEGDLAVLDLENTSSNDYYFVLIDIQANNDFNVLFPNSSRSKYLRPDSVYVPANQRINWGDPLKAIPPFGNEKLLMIASKTPDIGRMIESGPLSKQKSTLLREIKWILEGQPSRIFKDCFFSIMDMVILPGSKEKKETKPAKGTGNSLSAFKNFFSGDDRCIDKIKDPVNNLIDVYPLIDISQPLQAGAKRGPLESHDVKEKTFVIKGLINSKKKIKSVVVSGEKPGINYPVQRDTTSYAGPRSGWEAEVNLTEGKNSFKIIATTVDGMENCEELVLDFKEEPKQQVKEPRNFSLIIGINKYDNWEKLEGAQLDAKSIRTLLKDSFDFNDKYAIELYDKAATYDRIDSVFRSLIDSLGSNDNLLVYYAGHGTIDSKINEGYWIPVEAKKDRPKDFISNSEIQKYLEKLPAKHIVVFADACFSGAFFATNRPNAVERSLKDEDELGSKWLVCSGRKQLVNDKMWGKENSPFAFYLMKFLKEAPAGGLKVGQLYDQLKDNVKKEEDGDQTPIAGPINFTGNDGGQYIFKKKKGEKSQPAPKPVKPPKTTTQKPPPAKPKPTTPPKKPRV